MFAISNDNALFVAGYPDAEKKTVYNLTIQATDSYNQATKQVFILRKKSHVGSQMNFNAVTVSEILSHHSTLT